MIRRSYLFFAILCFGNLLVLPRPVGASPTANEAPSIKQLHKIRLRSAFQRNKSAVVRGLARAFSKRTLVAGWRFFAKGHYKVWASKTWAKRELDGTVVISTRAIDPATDDLIVRHQFRQKPIRSITLKNVVDSGGRLIEGPVTYRIDSPKDAQRLLAVHKDKTLPPEVVAIDGGDITTVELSLDGDEVFRETHHYDFKDGDRIRTTREQLVAGTIKRGQWKTVDVDQRTIDVNHGMRPLQLASLTGARTQAILKSTPMEMTITMAAIFAVLKYGLQIDGHGAMIGAIAPKAITVPFFLWKGISSAYLENDGPQTDTDRTLLTGTPLADAP